MTPREFFLLYEKLISGTITADEKQRLLEYTDQIEAEEHPWQAEMGDKAEIEEELHALLEKDIRPKRRTKIRTLTTILTAAAAVTGLVILFSSIYKNNSKLPPAAPKTLAANKVTPGSNKAILTLADGSTITLDSAGAGSLTTKNGVTIKQVQNGLIEYNDRTGTNATSWSTISTPTGGQYQIVLEDGTKAWLNATSSLRFPTTFRNNERTVEISGEVYFEIAKDESKPFKVNFNGNTITVLGTHFNVMAYKDEAKSKVTLLQGAVKVNNRSGEQLLRPGMQAQITDSISQITTCKANLEEAIAWKNGFFTFDHENIQSIMRKLARWYDVRVNYQGDMTGKIFSGTISRFDNISEVLSMIELTGTIHFRIQGRELTVLP
ncbi:FecR family protein [Chitinophaga silvisoli]|uniref:FecR family protein n=1 Tax=Chitinophaga silvisoli TaxID=2291814 RepID=A0A3E1NV18_9BACT|nr:FecR family protein [Chitinophaga silvisoli]RFM31795.1 FecR family protein [Chitinophaga silvisoli]